VIEESQSLKELRDFGLLSGVLMLAIFGLALPLLRGHPFPLWPWIVALALTAAALAWPSALRPILWFWIRLGFALGWVNSRIVLTVLFFAVIVPMGLLMRALGRDPVARKLDPDRTTYRIPSRPRTREDMERIF
jgi:hypothetical protein